MPYSHSKRPALTGLVLTIVLLTAGSALAQHYTRTNLTANAPGVATVPNIDPNLVNAWGMSRSSGSPWWIADNGTGLSTLYNATGAAQSLVVTIPPPAGHEGASTPTGTAFNYANGAFELAPGLRSIFIFVTEDGTIAGWNPTVNPTVAVIMVDNSAKGANYKGVAIGKTKSGALRLYAANFASGKVEVYNSKFQEITHDSDFEDSKLPPNYVPFGIQNVGGNIVVAFAKRAPGEEEQHGPGLGYVSVFDLNGNLLLRLQHGPFLNAPWGIAQAPGDFGTFSHRLLIGNFGDGFIHAFNAVNGKFEGTLLDEAGAPIWIDGLWALSFGGNNANSGLGNELFFTAGPNDENDGLFGKLFPVAADQRGNTE